MQKVVHRGEFGTLDVKPGLFGWKNDRLASNGALEESQAHLRHDSVWVPEVGGREAEQSEAGVEDQVLAAIICDEALSVVESVVLNCKPSVRVIQVSSTNESTIDVA